MEKTAVIFAGRNGLDHESLRYATIRVPEVSMRIREAQGILDSLMPGRIDLYNYLASENKQFLLDIKLKPYAAAVVQIGLFDRLKKNRVEAQYLIGNSNGDSALKVCAKILTLAEMTLQSSLIVGLSEKVRLMPDLATPSLAGFNMTEYQLYGLKNNVSDSSTVKNAIYQSENESALDFAELLNQLVENQGVSRVINVGPQLGFDLQIFKNKQILNFDLLDSTEVDPLLTWIYKEGQRTA